MSDEPAGAAAGAGHANRAERDAEASHKTEGEPHDHDHSEEQAQRADTFGLEIGFAAQVCGQTKGCGNKGGEECGADLKKIEDALTPACGDGVEAAENPAGREGQDDLRDRKNDADDDGENTEQAQCPGEGHRWCSLCPVAGAEGECG